MTRTAGSAAERARQGRPQVGDPLWSALVTVDTEVTELKTRVDAHDRVLAPAFSPREESDSMSNRGPGAHPAEPFVMRQASTRADPWAEDVEHSPGYMDAIRNGTPMPDLRKRSAEDAVTRAIAHEPNPVIYESPAWCGRWFPWGQCRPATPCGSCQGHRTVVRDTSASGPVQTSRPFPGQGQPPEPRVPEPAPVLWDDLPQRDTGGPDFLAARQHALPQRPPGEGETILKGL